MPRTGSGGATRASSDYISGTTISSTAVNNDLNDIVVMVAGSIAADGQTPITANLQMSSNKHTNVGASAAQNEYMRTDQVQKGTANLLTGVGGTADVITATAAFSMSALVSGMRFIAVMASTSTSTTPTLNPNGIGAKTIKRDAGDPLAVGDIVASTVSEFFYDGTDFILLNPATIAGQITVANVPDLPTSKTTSGTFDAARIPSLDTSKITTGTMAAARLPDATTTAEGIVELATTAEMTAGTANKIPDADKVKAFVSSFVDNSESESLCKAWINFDGEGTISIRDSFNVTSITDLGVGDYTVTLTTAMADTNYSAMTGAGPDVTSTTEARNSYAYTYATGSFKIRVLDNDSAAGRDSGRVIAQVFGGQ